jgi:hypothetical protein
VQRGSSALQCSSRWRSARLKWAEKLMEPAVKKLPPSSRLAGLRRDKGKAALRRLKVKGIKVKGRELPPSSRLAGLRRDKGKAVPPVKSKKYESKRLGASAFVPFGGTTARQGEGGAAG